MYHTDPSRKKIVITLSNESLIHHSSYDNTTDKFIFIEEFRKEYRPAEGNNHWLP